MAFVISQTFDCAAYYLGTLVLNLHKGIGRTILIALVNIKNNTLSTSLAMNAREFKDDFKNG